MDTFKCLKNELEEIKNRCHEKKRECNSWDSKIKLLLEMKNKKKIEESDTGNIYALKNEIRKLQVRVKIIYPYYSNIGKCSF